MSLNPDIRDQAYQFFIEEAQELLQVLEYGLLNLKDDHSTSKVHELMRAAHSIKGGAASVELDTIKLIAHRLEDFFKALYSEKVQFDSTLESLLLQAYDGLREPLTEQMEHGSFDEEAALLTLEPIFEELEEILGEALQEADSYIPSATDLGVDIVASIFEVDVQQSLEQLESLLLNPEGSDLVAEFSAQLEVLSGFAELFTLPGFSEIIELGSLAISLSPDSAAEVIAIFIQNCQEARTAILDGDRSRGGEPSPELIAIANTSVPAVQEDSELLAELTSAGMALEEPWQSLDVQEEYDSGLENLFGNTVEMPAHEGFADGYDSHEENTEILSSQNEIPTDNPNLDLAEDLFGGSSLDSDADNVFDFAPSEEAFSWEEAANDDSDVDAIEASNVFDFAPSEEAFSWEEAANDDSDVDAVEEVNIYGFVPLENPAEADLSDNHPVDEMAEQANLFEFALAEDNTKLDWGEIKANSSQVENSDDGIDIIDFGSKILNGENVGSIAEAEKTASRYDEYNFEIEEPEAEEPEAAPSKEEPSFATPENLDRAVDSISEIFSQLPPVETQEFTDSSEVAKPAPTKRKSSQPAPVGKQLSVRVDLERLERMNNLIGELVINRNSLSLQNEQLQVNVKNLMGKFSRFRTVTGKLRELSDQMLVESGDVRNRLSAETDNSAFGSATADFDALEMDSYDRLQLLLQDVIEEILQLEEGVDDVALFAQRSDRTINAQRQMLGQMRDELMWARMLPLEQILKRFPRTLRDLSREYQKPVELNLIGTDVLVDKAVLEKLYDPLLHLLRNGFDHGIETPEIRSQQNKPKSGTIEIQAYYQGNQTIIEVRDDGKGLDVSKIASKAIERGLISAEEVANASPESLFELIFEPGFSTADKVSEISGRGVGMSVVREQIESLKGSISVTSTPGKGSTFTLALPLTLTIAKLLVVSLDETAFALPSDSIEEIIIPTQEQITVSGGQRFLQWNDSLVSIYNLGEMLQYNCTIIPLDNNSRVFDSVAAPADWGLPLLLLRRGRQFFALEIDRAIAEQELVIKPFGSTLNAPGYLYGCTILSDGTLIPVLNSATLIAETLGEIVSSPAVQPVIPILDLEPEPLAIAEVPEPIEATASQKATLSQPALKQRTIMIVDDSTALRRTMALSLERHGYHIVQAKDGRDAVEQLQKNRNVDLIVCDVEMPHMNGFEFLGLRRRDSEMIQIPTIMLTSRSGIKHRKLATQLGANGYFSKPYVEQEFIKELDKILNNGTDSNLSRSKIKAAKMTLSSQVTILIVDDSSALRKTIALSLTNKGYRVLEARDGEEGIEKMYQNRDISLVICDIEMPKMNGFEVLTARRQDSVLKSIPMAMLTSRNTDKHRNLANKLGADAFFSKPYVENEFMVEIEKLIKKHKLKV